MWRKKSKRHNFFLLFRCVILKGAKHSKIFIILFLIFGVLLLQRPTFKNKFLRSSKNHKFFIEKEIIHNWLKTFVKNLELYYFYIDILYFFDVFLENYLIVMGFHEFFNANLMEKIVIIIFDLICLIKCFFKNFWYLGVIEFWNTYYCCQKLKDCFQE